MLEVLPIFEYFTYANFRSSRIASFLANLPRLQNFTLRNSNFRKRIDPTAILGAISSTYLAYIHLDLCVYKVREFTDFLRKHRKTLTEMIMERSILINGSWKGIFEMMRNELRLEVFDINSFLIEVETKDTVYVDRKEHAEDMQNDDISLLKRWAISDYVTHESTENWEMIEEKTFEDSELLGVIEVIGSTAVDRRSDSEVVDELRRQGNILRPAFNSSWDLFLMGNRLL